jgi:hypothetical protein
MEPLVWSSPEDARRVWERFDRDGLCWVRMPDAVELARHAPHRLIEATCGATPFAIQVNQIRVDDPTASGRRPYAVTNAEARFHIDQHPYLPPQLQILVCVQQAADPGGASLFVDTWKILDDLRGGALFESLFETQRVIQFHNLVWCAPTFSLRAGDLVCVHNGFPCASDRVGNEFQNLLGELAPVQFKLEPGDLLISNNHRTLHARTAFTDTRRHLVRILTWLDRPLAAPADLVEHAARIAMRTEHRARSEPLWIRKRLGFSGRAPGHERYERDDLLAHYRGELVEDRERQLRLLLAHGRASGIANDSQEVAAR